jgi:L-ribulokinase
MARLKEQSYAPIADNAAVYDELYREYLRLHDYFGRGGNDVMKTLRRLRSQASGAADGNLGAASPTQTAAEPAAAEA